jgi:alpha/beta superfamily hydrolase
MYDFTFLAPCPASGIVVQGTADEQNSEADVAKLVDRLNNQKNITIDYRKVDGANHFFTEHMDEMNAAVGSYLDTALGLKPQIAATG